MALPPRLWTTDAAAVPALLREQGFVALPPATLAAVAQRPLVALDALKDSWNRLPPDRWLRDGGSYRHRRHDSYVVTTGADAGLRLVQHRAHWQPVEYNALHGGLERWFEPVEDAVRTSPAWPALIEGLARVFGAITDTARWFVEAHQFRIDTADGIGRPTPEGAHRDGVDFVAVILVDRRSVRGGETRVFDAQGPAGVRFVIEEPWSALLLDDARVIHETTPIQPAGESGWRDTLVLTYRSGGFLGK
jgi:hypothetical protein